MPLAERICTEKVIRVQYLRLLVVRSSVVDWFVLIRKPGALAAVAKAFQHMVSVLYFNIISILVRSLSKIRSIFITISIAFQRYFCGYKPVFDFTQALNE